MEKSGFWNFFGLVSWRNLEKIEKDIKDLEESEKKDLGNLTNISIENNAKLEQLIELKMDKIMETVQMNTQEIMDSIKECHTAILKVEEELQSLQKSNHVEHGALYTEISQIRKNLDENYKKLMECIVEYNGVIKSTDWKIGTSLAVFKNDLIDIVDRIDNMDPIVNLDKIESLLKILVINDMLDETKKLDGISNKEMEKEQLVTKKKEEEDN